MLLAQRFRLSIGFAVVCAGMLIGAPACSRSDQQAPPRDPPNVLWIVWDTVRSDRMSLYGYQKSTTPHLEQWARNARVFDNCIAAASYTVPSHASMFTGLLPTEHGAHNQHQYLDDKYTTVAELFRDNGYQTYLYSANPHISSAENFAQGFDTEEHPWDPQYRMDAYRIVRRKIHPTDRSSELPDKLKSGRVRMWDIKASGELAQRGLENWLLARDTERPFFAFLNYMEAHRPYVPPEDFRRRVMTPEQVTHSYQVDRSWMTMWQYNFKLHEYRPDELDIMAGTYDATIAELDQLFHDLITSLDAKGCLDNTVVILTSDHGEHLGEHHLLDHQYSIYNPLLSVPLVIHYPPEFKPARDRRPAVNSDIFPTLLQLAGIKPPPALESRAVSLLSLTEQRPRLAEYPATFAEPFPAIKRLHPDWKPDPWNRRLRAFLAGPHKYIWASDGKHELYDLTNDPGEQKNLLPQQSAVADRLAAGLDAYIGTVRAAGEKKPPPAMSDQQRRLLQSLGYLRKTEDQKSVPASAPTSQAQPK